MLGRTNYHSLQENTTTPLQAARFLQSINLGDEGLGGLCIWSQDQGIHWQRSAPANDLSSCKWERKSDVVGQASFFMRNLRENVFVDCWLKIVIDVNNTEHPAAPSL